MEFNWVETMDQVISVALMSNDVVELKPEFAEQAEQLAAEAADQPVTVPVNSPNTEISDIAANV
jgi:hypothetical protein